MSRSCFSSDDGASAWPAFAVVLALLGAHVGRAADPPALSPEVAHALKEITGERIIGDARVLCDPKFRGRRAGAPGVGLAAQYVADRFRTLGLRPGGGAGSYYQKFKIRRGYRMSSELILRIGRTAQTPLQSSADYMPLHLPNAKAEVDGACAFAGYGITSPALAFDEYAGLDVTGKTVLVFAGLPWSRATDAWIRRGPETRRLGTVAYKARNAANHGAACLLIADNPVGWRSSLDVQGRLLLPDRDAPMDAPIPVIHVTLPVAAKFTSLSPAELRLLALNITRQRKPESMLLRGRFIRFCGSLAGSASIGRNIIGVMPGRDDKLRREAVVIGGHYDHLGADDDTILFGANDNAAGVGAVLAVARGFGLLPRAARRTLIFVAFDAEEIGRMGSKRYVGRPCVPIDQTVLMINFDMIGRNEPDHIYAVGTRSSPELDQIHQRVNRHVGLRLEHPATYRLGRSDHSSFYFAGVPILYLFGGLDPDYNTPGDTWNKLLPKKVEKVARLAFLTAREVAERRDRIRFDDSGAPLGDFGLGATTR